MGKGRQQEALMSLYKAIKTVTSSEIIKVAACLVAGRGVPAAHTPHEVRSVFYTRSIEDRRR